MAQVERGTVVDQRLAGTPAVEAGVEPDRTGPAEIARVPDAASVLGSPGIGAGVASCPARSADRNSPCSDSTCPGPCASIHQRAQRSSSRRRQKQVRDGPDLARRPCRHRLVLPRRGTRIPEGGGESHRRGVRPQIRDRGTSATRVRPGHVRPISRGRAHRRRQSRPVRSRRWSRAGRRRRRR